MFDNMAVLQLPVNPLDEEQLKLKIKIINKIVPLGHQKGLLIYFGDVFPNYNSLFNQVKKNILAYVPSDFILTLHAPFSSHCPNRYLNFSLPESIVFFKQTIKLAEEIKAKSITVHFGTNYYQSSVDNSPEMLVWPYKDNNFDKIKEEIIFPAFENIKLLANQTEIKIGVENMPVPLKGNVTTNPKEIIYEPSFVTKEFFLLFANFFRDTPNVGLCFDTAHYGLARDSINKLLDDHEDNYIMNNQFTKFGYGPLYPGNFSIQPSMCDLIKEFIFMGGRVFDVQLVDYGQIWKPERKEKNDDGQILEEGLGLLEGLSGKEILDVGKFINNLDNNIPISFDIEVENFLEPVKQVSAALIYIDFIGGKLDVDFSFNHKNKNLVSSYYEKAKKIISNISL